MDTPTLRQLLSEARLPASVDVSHVEDGEGYGLHDSATGEPLPFSWPRGEVVMALLNAAPALLDVVEAVRELGVQRARLRRGDMAALVITNESRVFDLADRLAAEGRDG